MNKRSRRGLRIFQMIQTNRKGYHMPRLTVHEQALREDKSREKAKAWRAK